MNNEIISYLAGAIDSDGCITIKNLHMGREF